MPLHPKFIIFFQKLQIFTSFNFSQKFSYFDKFPKFSIYHQSVRGITFSIFYHIHINLQYTLDKVFFASSYTSSSKTLLTRPNLVTSSPFFAGPSLASLAIVSVLWQSCGKPSTKFPHGGLVECLFIQNLSFSFKNFKFSHLSIFPRNFHILINSQNFRYIINLFVALRFPYFITSTSIFNTRLTRFSLRLHILHRAKPC